MEGANAYGAGLSLPSAGRKMAYLLRVPRTGTLDSIEGKLGLVTTPADIKISLQDVDATTGNPDGVVDQFRVIPSASVVTDAWLSAVLTLDGTDTGTKRTVTRGDWLAVVLEFDSAAGNLILNFTLSGNAWDTLEYPRIFNGAIWTKPTPQLPAYVFKYTDGVYAMSRAGSIAPSVLSSVNPTTVTTPDEYALHFQVPFTATIAGALVYLRFSSGTYNVVLYAPNGVVLHTAPGNRSGGGSSGPVFTQFTAPITLAPDAPYRLAVVPTTTTVVKLSTFGVSSCGVMSAAAGGQSWYLSTRTDAGVWTDSTLERPLIAPFLLDVG
jgi:hypothetical protein